MRGRSVRSAADPTDEAAAWVAALRRLARQPLPRVVLGERLRQLGYTPSVVTTTLDRAQQLGYLDDRAYAHSLVRRRSQTRGVSLIARELRSKGVGEDDVSSAMEQVDPDAEEERALALARSALNRRRPATADELRRRVGAVLSRRGFRTSTIIRVIGRLREDDRLAQVSADVTEAADD
jgi:regulatory protein